LVRYNLENLGNPTCKIERIKDELIFGKNQVQTFRVLQDLDLVVVSYIKNNKPMMTVLPISKPSQEEHLVGTDSHKTVYTSI
jgi:hypothetical protein